MTEVQGQNQVNVAGLSLVTVAILAKLDQLLHAASYLTANVRYFFSSSSNPEGNGIPVRHQGETIPIVSRSWSGTGHPQALCGHLLVY